jgi:GAF domain-containing protein
MRLRGQTIGKLKFKHANDNRTWTEEEISLAEAALERAAIALENARLLEEAQRRATKERVISEGSTRVSAALDVKSVLQTTAEELERALGSSEVIIQLESEG